MPTRRTGNRETPTRRVEVGALVLAILLSLPGLSRAQPLSRGHTVWLITGSAVTHLAHARGGRHLLQGYLNHQTTWIYGKSADAPSRALRVRGAASLAGFRRAVTRRGRAVLLDLEHWPLTPGPEQHHPLATYARAAAWAHRQGKILIATPAFDLVHSLEPRYRGRIYPEFLRLDLAGALASEAGVYEIQAQGAENHPARYRTLVIAIVRQIRKINPHTVILAGLSTGPSGHKTTAETLCRDARATRNQVSGYWLNIPGRGRACPRCTKPRPAVAIRFLRRMAQSVDASP